MATNTKRIKRLLNGKMLQGYVAFDATDATVELSIATNAIVQSVTLTPVFNSDATPDIVYVKEAVTGSEDYEIQVPSTGTITLRRNTQNVSGMGVFYQIIYY